MALSHADSGNHYTLYVYDCATGEQMLERWGPSMIAMDWAPQSKFVAVTEGRGIIIFFTPEGCSTTGCPTPSIWLHTRNAQAILRTFPFVFASHQHYVYGTIYIIKR